MQHVDAPAEAALHTRRILSRAAWLMSAVVAAIGFIVLTGGWLGGVDALRRVHAAYAAMAPSTALCFCLSSALVLVDLTPLHPDVTARVAALAGSAAVAAIALANLAVAALSPLTGLDALLFSASALFAGDYMATATSISFLLAAFAQGYAAKRAGPLFTAAATLGLVISLVALIGYLFDARAL
jgi:hypothetical protein